MTDLFNSGDSSGLSDSSAGDAELQQFLLIERERAKIQAQIHEFSDICWEKCMDKPGSKLDSRTETCLSNCVDRFIDVSLLIANRFSQLVQKNSSNY